MMQTEAGPDGDVATASAIEPSGRSIQRHVITIGSSRRVLTLP